MATRHVSHDEFFSKLSAELGQRHAVGSGRVYLTQTRITQGHDIDLPDNTGETDALDSDLEPNVLWSGPVIIRATDGKKKDKKLKFSTIVQPSDLAAFFARYLDTCKSGMTALRPRDRTKKRKAKARKKKMTGPSTA